MSLARELPTVGKMRVKGSVGRRGRMAEGRPCSQGMTRKVVALPSSEGKTDRTVGH